MNWIFVRLIIIEWFSWNDNYDANIYSDLILASEVCYWCNIFYLKKVNSQKKLEDKSHTFYFSTVIWTCATIISIKRNKTIISTALKHFRTAKKKFCWRALRYFYISEQQQPWSGWSGWSGWTGGGLIGALLKIKTSKFDWNECSTPPNGMYKHPWERWIFPGVKLPWKWVRPTKSCSPDLL